MHYSRRSFIQQAAGFGTLAAVLCDAPARAAQQRSPNIVYFMCDELGYYD